MITDEDENKKNEQRIHVLAMTIIKRHPNDATIDDKSILVEYRGITTQRMASFQNSFDEYLNLKVNLK